MRTAMVAGTSIIAMIAAVLTATGTLQNVISFQSELNEAVFTVCMIFISSASWLFCLPESQDN